MPGYLYSFTFETPLSDAGMVLMEGELKLAFKTKDVTVARRQADVGCTLTPAKAGPVIRKLLGKHPGMELQSGAKL